MNITSAQLLHAAGIKDEIDALESELNRLLGGSVGNGILPAKRRGRLPGKKRRKMSAAGRAGIAAAARARWRKAKKAGRNRL